MRDAGLTDESSARTPPKYDTNKGGGRGLGEGMRGMNAPRNKEEAAAQGSAAAEIGNNSVKRKTTWNAFYSFKLLL